MNVKRIMLEGYRLSFPGNVWSKNLSQDVALVKCFDRHNKIPRMSSCFNANSMNYFPFLVVYIYISLPGQLVQYSHWHT